MLKINLNNELLKIEKCDIDSRIEKAITDPKIKSHIFKIKKINYFTIIGLFILGVIIICVGAFFQEGTKKPIMISCIVIGVSILGSTLIPAFVCPYISFKILKNSALKHINSTFIADIFQIFCAKIENIQFERISFKDKYIEMQFSIESKSFLLTKQNNLLVLKTNNEMLSSKKVMVFHSQDIKYKLNVIDTYKQSNIDNFVIFISDEIKYKMQMILKDIVDLVNSSEGV